MNDIRNFDEETRNDLEGLIAMELDITIDALADELFDEKYLNALDLAKLTTRLKRMRDIVFNVYHNPTTHLEGLEEADYEYLKERAIVYANDGLRKYVNIACALREVDYE